MAEKRTIPAKAFVADIRNQMNNDELKKKYSISDQELNKLFQKLLKIKAFTENELADRMQNRAEANGRYRRQNRCYSLFSIPVYDTKNLELEGWITDITDRGLQLSGMPAQVGQSRSLLIRADEFHDIFPFAFDAQCKWVSVEDGEPSVGFEITDISETGLQELKKLIELLTIN